MLEACDGLHASARSGHSSKRDGSRDNWSYRLDNGEEWLEGGGC